MKYIHIIILFYIIYFNIDFDYFLSRYLNCDDITLNVFKTIKPEFR